MQVNVGLSSEEIKPNTAFIFFLYENVLGKELPHRTWYDQVTEHVTYQETNYMENLNKAFEKVLENEECKEYILEAYNIFKNLLIGAYENIPILQSFRPLFVVGAPRTGGTYMLKQMLKATGEDYKKMNGSLCHDGCPMIQYSNTAQTLLNIAEYIVMLKVYYKNKKEEIAVIENKVIVPKKLCTLPELYYIFTKVFPQADYIVTYRHPQHFIKSLLDKKRSVGKKYKKYKLTSKHENVLWIEALTKELLEFKGISNVDDMTFFDTSLKYYYNYYKTIINCGILSNPQSHLVEFGKGMEEYTQKYYDLFNPVLGNDFKSEEFYIDEKKRTLKEFNKLQVEQCNDVDNYLRQELGL